MKQKDQDINNIDEQDLNQESAADMQAEDLEAEQADKREDQAEADELSACQDKLHEAVAAWQRAAADYQNFKKNTDKKMSELREFACLEIVLDILPVYNNFDQALEHVPEANKQQAWVIGLEHIKKQIHDLLDKHGVKAIKAKPSDEFDPQYHEALSQVESDEFSENQIVSIMQPGFSMHDKVIQPVKVIVAK